MENEFDIDVDDIGTLVFCINDNRWRGSDLYESDGLTNFGNSLYSYKNGEIWSHNVQGGVMNTFYGEPVSSFVGVVVFGKTGKIKIPKNVSVEGNLPPTSVKLKVTQPKNLQTIISATKFRRKEGIFYANVMKAGTGQSKVSGQQLRGPFIFALFEFNHQERLQLQFVNIGYTMSFGHENV